ncbi:MAG: TetR/AcrR family transcriptional regulator [Clostridia bacterium]|nr:TetR/AcrR family transcriptional regulator [Clostridia bacterium]
MPPKQRFTQEIILNKAYEMFARGGMTAVNARSVSKALNCSTQPLFSYFPDMSGLRKALIEKGIQDFRNALAAAENEGFSEIGRCCAYVRFAADYPMVFLHLLSVRETDPCVVLMQMPEAVIAAECASTGLSREAVLQACEELHIYVHGLACMVATGKTVDQPEEVIAKAYEAVFGRH